MSKLSVVIMAGGKSSRMGRDKSFVEILGQPMIEYLLRKVSDLGQDETLLITNRPADYAHLKLPMYPDVIPEKGSLGGIYSALHHSNSENTLIVACDMPFVNVKLLQYMISLCDEAIDIIVPRVKNYPQGLHAIYSQACLLPIRERLDADRLKVIGFYDKVRVHYLDESEYGSIDSNGLSFHNVNTPQELEKARQLANKLNAN